MKNNIRVIVGMLGIFASLQIQAQTIPHEMIKSIGIITVSVGNIRSEPAQSAELSTQALLGTTVKILEKAVGKNWYKIQMLDEYQGWIDGGAMVRMDSVEYSTFKKMGTELMVTSYLGYLHVKSTEKSEILSDLVFQNRLMGIKSENGFWRVKLPNGDIGYVSNKVVEPYSLWLKKNSEPTQNKMLKTAHDLLGIPYLWGGTSVKGLDCSGFTKMIFQANGWVLPRDASQQAREGNWVDSTKNGKNYFPEIYCFLEKSDLMVLTRWFTLDFGKAIKRIFMPQKRLGEPV